MVKPKTRAWLETTIEKWLKCDEIKEFMYSIKSEETKKNYVYNLARFVDFIKVRANDLLVLDARSIEDHIIKYIISMRDSNLSYSTILTRVSPIISFLDLNNVVINKKKIKKFFGEQKLVKDQAYSHDDIVKMVRVSNFKTKVIVLIYASTGIRRSAIIDLKLKHLERINEHKLYKVTVYEGTNDEYFTFTTPECANAIDDYIEKRKLADEIISPDSYLIRNNFDRTKIESVRSPKPINVNTLIDLLRALLLEAGLRTPQKSKSQRHEKAIFHGFRKYFATTLANSDVNQLIKEMLMGHSIGLDNSYYRPNDQKMLSEYLKAVPQLTIDSSQRLEKQLEKIEAEKTEIEHMESKHQGEIQNLRKQIDIMRPAYDLIIRNQEQLENIGQFIKKFRKEK